MERTLRIAIYLRLSKEDERDDGESNSIRMQRLLLRGFVSKRFEDYRLLEFQDDGYSGTNMDRPGVKALLGLAGKSGLDCVVVKDFSRFSRDYIELGSYLDRFFPLMGIRFISVNDRYDSSGYYGVSGGMEISFSQLLYDFYSKDLSVKVRSSLAVRRERGMNVGANCPFGYGRDPEDRHSLRIEEDEAEVVRRIFAMALEGMTSVQIARTLNQEGVKTPMEFKRERGRREKEAVGGGEAEGCGAVGGKAEERGAADGKTAGMGGAGVRPAWSGSAVCHILRNEVYVGDMVYGKTQKEVGGKNRLKPREEWKIVRGRNEPVVDRETFDTVRKNRGGRLPREGGQEKQPGGKRKKEGRHPLAGKLICGCCGRKLQLRGGLIPYFQCPGVYERGREGCVKKADALFLKEYIVYEMQREREGLADMGSISADEAVRTFEGKVIVSDEQRIRIVWPQHSVQYKEGGCDDDNDLTKGEESAGNSRTPGPG